VLVLAFDGIVLFSLVTRHGTKSHVLFFLYVASLDRGIAGDGKDQHSFYFSAWACVVTSYGLLDEWLIAADSSGVKAFIASWPHRAPAWICIMFLSLCSLVRIA
jgi:hypothetical protein